jgi:23S rRNA pseudoU1915 N3-methylase RlmH
MATKTGKYVKEQTNEVTITMTVKLTSIVKLPANDEAKAQKATDSEKARIMKALNKMGVDNFAISEEKTFVNLAE